MARSGSSSSHGASASRRRVVHPTPPSLPTVLCYRCQGGTVRTWVVEDEESKTFGKEILQAHLLPCECSSRSRPSFSHVGVLISMDPKTQVYRLLSLQESKSGACRFGFMWHDDYLPILEQLGVIQPRASQNRLTWDEAPTAEHSYAPDLVPMEARSHGRRSQAAPTAEAGCMLKALLIISFVQGGYVSTL
jgi:hypothetical protein